MKKLISLILAFAMVFSLAMPAFAAEDTRTIYFENTGNWSTVYAYAWGDSNTEYLGGWPGEAMTLVNGETNIYSIEVSTAAINVIFNNGGGSQTDDLTIPTDGKDMYDNSTGTWSTYTSASKTQSDVTASYTPVITISDIVLSGDAVTVDTENQTYTITIPADSESTVVTVTVSGQNLDKIPDDGSYLLAWAVYSTLTPFSYNNESGDLVFGSNVKVVDVGSRALAYSTDRGTTWTPTGWTVVVKQAESEPETPTLPDPIYFAVDQENAFVEVAFYDANGKVIALTADAYTLGTMTLVSGETNVYSYSGVPENAAKVMLLATNLEDLDDCISSDILTIPTDGKNMYDYANSQWTTYTPSGTTEPTKVSLNVKLKAIDSSTGTEITGDLTGYLDSGAVDNSAPSSRTLLTGDYTVTFADGVVPSGYKTPADVSVTVTDDGNGNGVLTSNSSHATVTTETIDGKTVYVITVKLEAETTEVSEAKWGASKDSLTGSGTLAEAIAAAEADSTVKYIQLQSAVTAESSFLITSGELTIDLNGQTVTCSDDYTFVVRNSGTKVTFADSGTTGVVTSESTDAAAIILLSSGEVLITGGSYSGDYALQIDSDSSAAITGGTFTSTNSYAINNSGTLTISGGTIGSGSWANVAVSGTTTITGGTFTGSGTDGNFSYYSGTLDLSGYSDVTGLKVSQWTEGDLTVSDTTIKLPDGYTFVDDSNNPVTTLTSGTVYTIAAEAVKYTVTVNAATNGTVTADKATAAEDDTVTLTWTTEGIYELDNIVVTDAGGNEVTITDKGLTAWTFTMPASNVTVTATFKKIATTSANIVWGSMAFTYTDGENGAKGAWSNDGSEKAGTVTVTNTGTTAITATPSYAAATDEYGTFTGSFDVASADLDAGVSKTFTLSLSGDPTKAIPAGTKIGTVTITIK